MIITNSDELSTVALKCICQGDSLPQIIDSVTKSANIQCAFLDLNNRLIIHSLIADGCLFWESTLEKGCLPYPLHELDKCLESDFKHMFKKGKSVLVKPGHKDNLFLLCSPVFTGFRPDSIMIARFREQESLQLAETVSALMIKLYSYFTQPDASYQSYHDDYSGASIARELLLHNGDMARLLFGDAYGINSNDHSAKFRPGYAVAAMRSIDSDIQSRGFEEVARGFANFVPNSFHVISDDCVLAFVYGLNRDSFLPGSDLMTQLARFTLRYRFYCSLSSMFNDLSQRLEFSRQAKVALKLGMDGNYEESVFTAGAMYADVIRLAAVERIGKEILEMSCIIRLVQYDKENGTDYLKTLEHYLSHANQLSSSASSMFIDRSTVKYRLGKIKCIIETDFDLPEIAKQLRQGIAIYRLGEANMIL